MRANLLAGHAVAVLETLAAYLLKFWQPRLSATHSHTHEEYCRQECSALRNRAYSTLSGASLALKPSNSNNALCPVESARPSSSGGRTTLYLQNGRIPQAAAQSFSRVESRVGLEKPVGAGGWRLLIFVVTSSWRLGPAYILQCSEGREVSLTRAIWFDPARKLVTRSDRVDRAFLHEPLRRRNALIWRGAVHRITL